MWFLDVSIGRDGLRKPFQYTFHDRETVGGLFVSNRAPDDGPGGEPRPASVIDGEREQELRVILPAFPGRFCLFERVSPANGEAPWRFRPEERVLVNLAPPPDQSSLHAFVDKPLADGTQILFHCRGTVWNVHCTVRRIP